MSRLGRVGRRPDDWATPHDRARSRAAEGLDEPLEPAEAAWLEEHLAGCEACRTTAREFEADHLALQSLRDSAPEPPRDLWARTAAAIEQEAAGGRRASAGPARRTPLAQWGAITGIAVVAVVVGSSVLSGGWLVAPDGTTTAPGDSVVAVVTPRPVATSTVVGPGATPMLVNAGNVGWFDVGADGSYSYNQADVSEVCAHVDQAGCVALDDGDHQPVTLSTSPKSIITSPSTSQAVVVGADESGGNQVFVVSLPSDREPLPTQGPSPSPTPAATPAPETPAPTGTASATPSSAPASAEPSPTPTTVETASPTSTATPTAAPTAAALAIVSGVTVVGDAAAFSADGVWFAFTARPADGSAGPDIYVWRVGDERARPVTTDHRSMFASWVDGLVIGSRPGVPPTLPAPPPGDSASPPPAEPPGPVTFSIDPATGAEAALASPGWRPAVDPTGRRAVLWDGSVVLTDGGLTFAMTDGHLVLVDWASDTTGEIEPDGTVVNDGPIADFTVRWDETGSWLAVWIADSGDPALGRLSLLHVDPDSGEIDRPADGPQDVPALSGFSIEDGRLAWATPPSQDGEGSRVQIVAWSADGVGTIESAPGQDVIVVR